MKLAILYEKRDYKREYKLFHGKPEQVKRRSMRNKARRKAGLKKGDGKEINHKNPLSQGGSNNRNNMEITSDKKTQRAEGNKVKYQNAKK